MIGQQKSRICCSGCPCLCVVADSVFVLKINRKRVGILQPCKHLRQRSFEKPNYLLETPRYVLTHRELNCACTLVRGLCKEMGFIRAKAHNKTVAVSRFVECSLMRNHK